MALPSAYKQVEYIQSSPTNPGGSSGTYQCIDTGYIPTLNTEISIDIQLTSTANQSTLFGETTTNTSYLSFISYVNSSNHWGWYMRNGNSGGTTDTNVTVDTNRHTFVVNKSTYKIYTNGTQVYSGSNTNSPSTNGQNNLFLFCNNNDGTKNIYSAAKLYSCKIYDSGTLVRDFVPVIRKSDNKPGLYDLVNNAFYTNQGTGEFTYKEYAESGQIQKIYIGVSQVRPKEEPTTTYNADFSTFNLMTTYWGGTPTYSNGIIKTTGEGGIAYKDVSGELDVNNAKKIVMECDYYAVGKTWATTARVYLDNGVPNNKGQSQSGYSIGQWILTQTASGYNTGTLVTFCGKSYGSATAGTEITYNTRHHLYAEFDIQNATWLCKVDDVQKGSGTLDSENITNYHNMTYSYINMYIETNNQIKNLSIQVTK